MRTLTIQFCLAAMLGLVLVACSSPTPATFDLTAPAVAGRSAPLRGQIAVSEPTALQYYDSQQIVVKEPGGGVSMLAGAQWPDRLPRLIQTRLIQTYQNASAVARVSRVGEREAAETRIALEIRAFHIDATMGEAVAELAVRFIDERSGQARGGRIYAAREPLGAVDGANGAQALDRALSRILTSIVVNTRS